MEIKIIAESKTTQKTIDRLIEETPELFPESCSLELFDSGERYKINREKIWNYGDEVTIKESQYLDGMQAGDLFWFNVRSVILKYGEKDSNKKIMILVNSNYIDLKVDVGIPIPQFVGNNLVGEISYGGHCDSEYSSIVVGIPNRPHSNNTKVAAHEIAHLYLDPFTKKRRFEHCRNYYNGLRCIMNIHQVTDKAFEEIGLKFCSPCYQKLEKASLSYMKKILRKVMRGLG